MPLGYLFTNPKAEAGSNILFGGKEGLENAIKVLRRNARAIVLYGEANRITLRQAHDGRRNRERTLQRQSINGIGDDIRCELMNLAAQGDDRRAWIECEGD